MTLPKIAQDPSQNPKNTAAIAISIAATTFTPHPLSHLRLKMLSCVSAQNQIEARFNL